MPLGILFRLLENHWTGDDLLKLTENERKAYFEDRKTQNLMWFVLHLIIMCMYVSSSFWRTSKNNPLKEKVSTHTSLLLTHLVVLCLKSMTTSTWAKEQLDRVSVTGTTQRLETDKHTYLNASVFHCILVWQYLKTKARFFYCISTVMQKNSNLFWTKGCMYVSG